MVRSKSPSRRKREKSDYYLILLLIGLAIMLIYEGIKEYKSANNGSQDFASTSLHPRQKVDQNVQRNLYLTEQEIELMNQKRKQELQVIQRNTPDKNQPPAHLLKQPDMLYGVDQTADRWEGLSTKETQQGRQRPDYYSASGEVYRDLQNKQLLSFENEKNREQYAKEFVENARRSGWEVSLGADFTILGIKPIPSQNKNRGPSSKNGALLNAK